MVWDFYIKHIFFLTFIVFACLCCNIETRPRWLSKGRKFCYMGHRRWLDDNHRFRTNRVVFDGNIERDPDITLGSIFWSAAKNAGNCIAGTFSTYGGTFETPPYVWFLVVSFIYLLIIFHNLILKSFHFTGTHWEHSKEVCRGVGT